MSEKFQIYWLSSYHFIKVFMRNPVCVLWHLIAISVWGISWNDVRTRAGQNNYINWSEWYVDVLRYYLKGVPLIIPGPSIVCYTTSMHFVVSQSRGVTLSRTNKWGKCFIVHRGGMTILIVIWRPTYFLWFRLFYCWCEGPGRRRAEEKLTDRDWGEKQLTGL